MPIAITLMIYLPLLSSAQAAPAAMPTRTALNPNS